MIDHAKSSRSSLHSPVRLYYYYALHLFSMYTSLVHSVFYIFILRSFSLLLSPHRFAYLANSQCVLAVRFELVLHSFSLLLCSPSPSPPPLTSTWPSLRSRLFSAQTGNAATRSCRCIGSLTGWLAGNAAVCQYVQDGGRIEKHHRVVRSVHVSLVSLVRRPFLFDRPFFPLRVSFSACPLRKNLYLRTTSQTCVRPNTVLTAAPILEALRRFSETPHVGDPGAAGRGGSQRPASKHTARWLSARCEW